MDTKSKKGKYSLRTWCAGMISATLMSVVTVAILSNLILREVIGENDTSKLIFVTLMLSGFCGGMVTRLLEKGKNLYTPAVVCVGYYCALLISGMLLFDGSAQHLLLSFCAVVVGCIFSCTLKLNKKRKRIIRNR